MQGNNENADWSSYQKLVLNELERHSKIIESVRDSVSKIKTDIEMLKYKSGMWGMLGATVPITILLLMSYVKGSP